MCQFWWSCRQHSDNACHLSLFTGQCAIWSKRASSQGSTRIIFGGVGNVSSSRDGLADFLVVPHSISACATLDWNWRSFITLLPVIPSREQSRLYRSHALITPTLVKCQKSIRYHLRVRLEYLQREMWASSISTPPMWVLYSLMMYEFPFPSTSVLQASQQCPFWRTCPVLVQFLSPMYLHIYHSFGHCIYWYTPQSVLSFLLSQTAWSRVKVSLLFQLDLLVQPFHPEIDLGVLQNLFSPSIFWFGLGFPLFGDGQSSCERYIIIIIITTWFIIHLW